MRENHFHLAGSGQLYILKEETGIPMTVLLDRAIKAYVDQENQPPLQSTDPEESDHQQI